MLTFRGDAWLTQYPEPGKRVRHDEDLAGWWFEVRGEDHRDPPAQSVDVGMLARRRAICEDCVENEGVREIILNQATTLMVKCRKCTKCEGGRNLAVIGHSCPLGKW